MVSSDVPDNMKDLKPRNIFGSDPNCSKISASTSSADSSCALQSPNISDTSASDIVFSPIEKEEENSITRNMLSLTIDEEKPLLDDSFSSAPDSKQNRGALAFMKLIEDMYKNKAATDSRNANFANLVVQMLDLELGERVPTSDAIPGLLENKGWNMKEVAGIWSVTPLCTGGNTWTEKSLDYMGGRGTCSNVWNKLKDSQLTGCPKRSYVEVTNVSSSKRRKTAQYGCYASMSSLSQGVIHMDSPKRASKMHSPSSSKDSKRRKNTTNPSSKITDWLMSSPSAAAFSPKSMQEPTPSKKELPELHEPREIKKRKRNQRKKPTTSAQTQSSTPLQAPAIACSLLNSSKKTPRTPLSAALSKKTASRTPTPNTALNFLAVPSSPGGQPSTSTYLSTSHCVDGRRQDKKQNSFPQASSRPRARLSAAGNGTLVELPTSEAKKQMPAL